MRISHQKASAAYDSIAEPITKLRVENNGGMSIEEMDERLFKLQQEIWSELVDALNLQTTK